MSKEPKTIKNDKQPKVWVPPTIEEVSAREPLEVAIIVAQTLARQAARRDHEQALLEATKNT